MLEALHEGHREDDILHIDGIGKERGDLFITEPCYTAADSGYKEGKAGVFLGETDEIVHIGFDGLNASLHCRDGICLTIHTDAFAPYSAKLLESQPGSTATVRPCQIAAEYDVNGNQKCSDFGNNECSIFGIKTTVLLASAVQ